MDQTLAPSDKSVVVIIPFYNGSKWIGRALDSVYHQTILPNEVIVVNDGSSPDELVLLEEHAIRYPFVLINKKNGGQGSARNVGVAASTSKYISFLDQDDYFLPNRIELFVNALPEEDSTLGFIYGDLYSTNCQGKILGQTLLLKSWKEQRHPKKRNLDHLVNNDLAIWPSAAWITRRAFEAVGGFDEQFIGYEDIDLFFRILCANFTNIFINTPVSVWCRHRGNTSSVLISTRMAKSRLLYFKKLLATYPWGIDGEHFYIGNMLVSHFRESFIRELICSFKNNIQQSERKALLKGFAEAIWAEKHVTFFYKLWNCLFLLFIHRWARCLAVFHKQLKVNCGGGCECGRGCRE